MASKGEMSESPSLDTHIDSVFRFALALTNDHHLSEELTQDCLLRAHQGIRMLKNEQALRPWLFKILTNLWRDRLRRRPREVTTESMDEFPAESRAARETIGNCEELERVVSEMRRLPPRQRQVLYLRAVEEFSIDQIALTLEISCSAAKASLSAARKKMRQKFFEAGRR